jgi:hypothetical protein
MTARTLEFYPTGDDKGLYYVEFGQWQGKAMTWQLFQRQYLYDEEEWERMKKEAPNDFYLMSNEVHPWNLGEGTVDEREHAMDMNTKKFLCFMVDALNEKAARIQRKRKMDELLAEHGWPRDDGVQMEKKVVLSDKLEPQVQQSEACQPGPLCDPKTGMLKVDKDVLESTLALCSHLTARDDVLSKLVDVRPAKKI